ncbi:hypothetical protein SCYAM73S_06898 [Streptomyces cyaneofuscatus]
MLRPVHAMTAKARRLSERTLHERIASSGPDDELKELGETLDALLARLEKAFDSQRRFVATASATLSATGSATLSATGSTTGSATGSAFRSATGSAFRSATGSASGPELCAGTVGVGEGVGEVAALSKAAATRSAAPASPSVVSATGEAGAGIDGFGSDGFGSDASVSDVDPAAEVVAGSGSVD